MFREKKIQRQKLENQELEDALERQHIIEGFLGAQRRRMDSKYDVDGNRFDTPASGHHSEALRIPEINAQDTPKDLDTPIYNETLKIMSKRGDAAVRLIGDQAVSAAVSDDHQ